MPELLDTDLVTGCKGWTLARVEELDEEDCEWRVLGGGGTLLARFA